MVKQYQDDQKAVLATRHSPNSAHTISLTITKLLVLCIVIDLQVLASCPGK